MGGRQSMEEPKAGDLLEISRGSHSHWGVYVGDGQVVHQTVPGGVYGFLASTFQYDVKRKRLVQKEPLSTALKGERFRVNNKYDRIYKCRPVAKIVRNAEAMVGKWVDYDLFDNNSEHFVTQLRYGIPDSDLEDPELADLIEIPRGLYSHWALYVGDGNVIHLSGPDGASSVASALTKTGVVKKEPLSAVVGDGKYWISRQYDEKYYRKPREAILRDAEAMVGKQMDYNLLRNNCEHFVTWLRHGVPRSMQAENVEDGLADGVLAGGLLGLAVQSS